MMRSSLLLILFLWIGTSMHAQSPADYCGTLPFESESLKEWRNSRPQANLRSNDTLYVSMKVHLVGTDEGDGFYPLSALLESFCKLNEDMAQSKIQMEMDPDINYIANSTYNDHNRITGQQMMNVYNENRKVNVYIVADPNGACGYFSRNGDAIALRKSCLGPFSTTWAHELGHYFSLPHTFLGWEGTDYEYGDIAPERIGEHNILVEKVDGSNCATAGDKFCDTPADYLSYRWQCSNGYSPDSLTDPDTTKFLVDGIYIMSYSNDGCQSIFSDEQIDAMIFNIQNNRASEISNNPLPKEIQFDPDNYSGTMGVNGEELQYDDVTLSWPPITHATRYYLQITIKKPFATPPDYFFIVQDTFLHLENFFSEDQAYEWEVMGFNGRYSCSELSEAFEFYASDLTSNINPEVQADLNLYPNPASTSSHLILSYDAPISTEGEIRIYNINGQELYVREVNWIQGQNTHTIRDLDLQSGMYVLKYKDERGIASRKIIIQ